MESTRKQIVLGILAHVDSGKTTLSEAMLYRAGVTRRLGRVDHKDAFLDTDALEKARGITIFSKQALLTAGDTDITLLDTPGHVDFSTETERTLQVLDYAVLVVSGTDGVQSHTETLWRLLRRYHVPTFVFVNKMDLPGMTREQLLSQLNHRLGEGFVDFGAEPAARNEALALCDEQLMEKMLDAGTLTDADIIPAVARRHVFPCWFGAALRLDGVDALLEGLDRYTRPAPALHAFGARVFKVSQDEQGTRLTWLRVTGGELKVKALLSGETDGEPWAEKANQLRLYSGAKYTLTEAIGPGQVCAVTGLTHAKPGTGLGAERDSDVPVLEPVLSYQVLLPEGADVHAALGKLHRLEEEEPQLHVVWNETLGEIHVQLMGEIQLEVLRQLCSRRFGIELDFGDCRILYRETISQPVVGYGHYEPLRHYAEVHLRLEPGQRGSGITFSSDCPTDLLGKNWQNLIRTHVFEKKHKGILTGSELCDVHITLLNGRAHIKHTEGGDFREATYRAIRQGLEQLAAASGCVLLEPYYEFHIAVPQNMVGRAMTDVEKMHGKFEGPYQEGEAQVLRGIAPVVCMANYQKEVTVYTKGLGKVTFRFAGYYPCHNTEEVVAQTGYDPERDLSHPADSVFCAHGAGFIVPWNEVPDHMHVEGRLLKKKEQQEEAPSGKKTKTYDPDHWIDIEEIDAILARTYHANKHEKGATKQWRTTKKVISGDNAPRYAPVKAVSKEEYLLVDGYNIIFAWESLKELAAVNIDGARGKLLDILCNYQGIKKCNLIVVFDAYRVKGHQTEMLDHHNIHVVYTKEAETADAYIEKFAHENGRKYHVTVATSDGLEQIIITGQGCHLLSAREFEREVEAANQTLRETIDGMREKSSNHILGDALKQLTDEKIQL